MQADGWQAPCENSSQPKTQRGRHVAAQCCYGTCPRAAVGFAPTRSPSSACSRWAWPCLRSQTRPRCPRVSMKRRTHVAHAPRTHESRTALPLSRRPLPPTRTLVRTPSEGRTCTLRVPRGSAESTASRPRCALVCAVRRLSVLGLPAVCTGCVLACAVQRLLHLLIQFAVWTFVVAFVVDLATLPGTPRYRRTRHTERRQGKALYIVRPLPTDQRQTSNPIPA
jgi:hypothetical protein